MSIPLERAYLCCNCQRVVELAIRDECSVCGSRALLSLDRVLNRQLAEKIAPEVMTGIQREFSVSHDSSFLLGMGIRP